MDRGHIECFLERQRWQDSRHAPRHHRFSGAGRADQQDVVAAGGGHFERPAREQLPAHVGEVGKRQGGRGT